jgi:hypothetical protein
VPGISPIADGVAQTAARKGEKPLIARLSQRSGDLSGETPRSY